MAPRFRRVLGSPAPRRPPAGQARIEEHREGNRDHRRRQRREAAAAQPHRERQRHQVPRGVDSAALRQGGAALGRQEAALPRRRVLGRAGRQRLAHRQQGRPGRRPRRAVHRRVGDRPGAPQQAGDQGSLRGTRPHVGHRRLPAHGAQQRPGAAGGRRSRRARGGRADRSRGGGLPGRGRGVVRAGLRHRSRTGSALSTRKLGGSEATPQGVGPGNVRPAPVRETTEGLRSPVAQYIYSMVRARKAHGDKVILDDVTLAFLPGAKIGVVGPNGAGKSTVLRIMAGLETASNGDVVLAPGASVGMLQQEPPLNEELDVRGNVEEAVADLRAALTRFEEVSAAMGEPDADFDKLLGEQGELMEVIENADGWELDARIEQAMDALRCPPGDADVTVLSGGERRRVALCKLLLEAPDLLLLDEPTNHLDAESVAWLEQHLEKYAGTVVAVTHDRYFLDNVAQWILELDRGRAHPYEGNYSTYLETKAARLKVEGAKDAKRAKRLKDELEWVRSGAKARQAKSKARLARYEEMAAEADKFRKLDFEEIQIPPG